MAERLSVSQAQYARWENGGGNPKDDTLEKIAEIFVSEQMPLKVKIMG